MTTEQIFHAINTNATSACNALIALYRRQEADEQASGTTRYENGVGFNGCDAGILSSFAEQVLNNRRIKELGGRAYPTDLTEKQLALLRKKLVKYSRQLLEIAEEKAARKAAKAATVPHNRPFCTQCGKPADQWDNTNATCNDCAPTLNIPADLRISWADSDPSMVQSGELATTGAGQ